ncbi:hypothetical protein HY004_01800, partial [Candidatus Saccharibacteria bacterium]|nr:hypothetical protein [Candidatus Saccharibacteria bacterium]
MGKIIEGISGQRIGFTTLNSSANNYAVALMNISPKTGNKKDLLKKIYATSVAGATPLKTAVRDVGLYYQCANNNKFFSTGGSPGSANCPIPAAPLGTCQQNDTVLITDGYYTDSISGIGNTDGDVNTLYDGRSFADAYSNTLAD